MKTVLAISVLAAIFLVGGSIWSKNIQENDPDLVSTRGLHWHAKLSIFSKGEQVVIPANIGIGAVHQPMHTHDKDVADGALHMEFGGVVRTSDLKLGNFFHTWDKDMHTAFGTLESMSVNGATSTAYEKYEMKDGDNIVLRYE